MSRFSAEEITAGWGEKCSEYEPECFTCQMWAQQDEIERLEDKVEGLTTDLDSAVEVAFKRGATEWVRLNYPDHFKRLSADRPRA
jgi:hypothetical protein